MTPLEIMQDQQRRIENKIRNLNVRILGRTATSDEVSALSTMKTAHGVLGASITSLQDAIVAAQTPV
jgi:hypothetical protein